MSKTKGFRFKNIEDKEYVLDVVNKIADRYNDEIEVQADCIVKLCRLYEEGVEGLGVEQYSHSVQETLRLADCQFIKYEGLIQGFRCYEDYHKKRKSSEIGLDHDKVIASCVLCKIGKAKAIQNSVESQFRKKGITSFVKLINDLIRIDHEGAVAQIFLCQAKRFSEDELRLSPDCVHFNCAELDDELVVIDEHCLKQTNPYTLEPPCRYLVAPFLRVPITIPEETQAIVEELKQLENQDVPDQPKEVDAEYQVKGDSE